MPKDVQASLDGQEVKSEETEVQPTPNSDQETEEKGSNEPDVEKLRSGFEKLKSRVAKEQSEKNDYKAQLDEAKAKLAELTKGHGKDKDKQEDPELVKLKKANQELELKLARNDRLKEVGSIIKSSGFNVSDDVLNLVVKDPNDMESTQANAEAIINLIREVQETTKKSFMKGATPTNDGQTIKQSKSLAQMTITERAKLRNSDPQLYQQMLKEAGF